MTADDFGPASDSAHQATATSRGTALNGDADLLRQLVREVLAEALRGVAGPSGPRPAQPVPARPDGPPNSAQPGPAQPDQQRNPAQRLSRTTAGQPPVPCPLPPSPPTSDPPADPPPSGTAYSSRKTTIDPRIHPAGGGTRTAPAGPDTGLAGTGAGLAGTGAGLAGTARLAGTGAGAEAWTVRLSTDEELHAFVLRVVKLADNPKFRSALLSGRARFRLAAQSHGTADIVVRRVDKGAVTERAVAEAARAGARLVLGPRAVLTPLARDKARALGVPIEKER